MYQARVTIVVGLLPDDPTPTTTASVGEGYTMQKAVAEALGKVLDPSMIPDILEEVGGAKW